MWLSRAVALALVLGGCFFYFGKVRPENVRQAQSLQSIIDAQRAQNAAIERSLDVEARKAIEIQERVKREQETAKAAGEEAKRRAGHPPAANPHRGNKMTAASPTST